MTASAAAIIVQSSEGALFWISSVVGDYLVSAVGLLAAIWIHVCEEYRKIMYEFRRRVRRGPTVPLSLAEISTVTYRAGPHLPGPANARARRGLGLNTDRPDEVQVAPLVLAVAGAAGSARTGSLAGRQCVLCHVQGTRFPCPVRSENMRAKVGVVDLDVLKKSLNFILTFGIFKNHSGYDSSKT